VAPAGAQAASEETAGLMYFLRTPLELGTDQHVCSLSMVNAGPNMADPRFESQNNYPTHHYSRWPDPWRPEDHWGPITAVVLFLIILGGLVIYGANNLKRVSVLDDATVGRHSVVPPKTAADDEFFVIDWRSSPLS
jgi:hypothetical protein